MQAGDTLNIGSSTTGDKVSGADAIVDLGASSTLTDSSSSDVIKINSGDTVTASDDTVSLHHCCVVSPVYYTDLFEVTGVETVDLRMTNITVTKLRSKVARNRINPDALDGLGVEMAGI